MAKALTLGFMALIAIASSACSVKQEDQSYKYSFSDNFCKTSHEFSSKDAYCSALLDETLNNGCARQMRIQSWEGNCR